ncbi:hypothetical protein ATO8_20294 [Roseivivax marinus]|uniref:Uncharacterized protein n=1 Tax=Roseivivax marinus TaxID=1379903 RepID=W4HDH2_9RHOB|nr:hypothetical protein [Roseivivax marinus]ETW10832.1 hypothetical protein ATO8_20294 [Roseivivax marinus]
MLTLLDFVESAEAQDAPYKTRLEIAKLPKRLRLDEIEDLVDYAADLRTFGEQIAPSGEAVFAKARDPRKAKEQANSRIRTALKAYLAAQGDAPTPEVHPDYAQVQAWVRNNEGFIQRGDRYPNGRSAAIASLGARFRGTALRDLTAKDAGAMLGELPSGKRRSYRNALAFIDTLRATAASLPPEIAACLPMESLKMPGSDRPVRWPDLPAELRASAEAVFDQLLQHTSLQAQSALDRIRAGEDPEVVKADVNAQRAKDVSNSAKWRESQRGHVSWLYRGALRLGRKAKSLEDVVTLDVAEAAIADLQEQVRAGRVRALDETCTLKTRLGGVIYLAAKGLRDPQGAAALEVLRSSRKAEIRNPYIKGLSKSADALVDTLHDGGDAIYRRIVTAPELIEAEVRAQLAQWSTMPLNRRLETLKLGASAAIWALQLCRPRRRANVMYERLRAARDPVTRKQLHSRTLSEEGEGYVSLTPKSEVKNLRQLEFAVRAQDARVLRWWIEELRPLYLETRDIADSCYLFPGSATPRNLRDGLVLPPGCVSAAWFSEAWTAGAKIVGLTLTSHQARHTTAVIWLARHPGDFAGAAAILGSSEDIVRRKYGADDSASVADQARADAYRIYGT